MNFTVALVVLGFLCTGACGSPPRHAQKTPEASGGGSGGTAGTAGSAGSSGIAGAGGTAGSPSSGGTGGQTRDASVADSATDRGSDGARDAAPGATVKVNWPTFKFDNARTGWNGSERTLTTAVVSDPQKFGKLFSRPVDGQIYAQPLIVANLTVGGKVRDLVFVATETNNVYAFDANDAAETKALWTVNFGKPAPAPGTGSAVNLAPVMGITSTPTIDTASTTVYLTTNTVENGKYTHKLHALDLVTGNEKYGGPVVIGAAVPGNADGSNGGTLTFDARVHLQRPALLLQAGTVFVAFGSIADYNNYNGWVMGYDAQTLKQKGVFVTAPNKGHGAAIWMSGNGLVGDGTGVYFATGNGIHGATDPNATPPQLGEALVKLDNDVALKDWHIRSNYAQLDGSDADYGSSGPLLIARTNQLVMGGKDSAILVYDRNNLGKYKPNDTDAVMQKFTGTGPSTLHGVHSGGFVSWEGPVGTVVFAWPGASRLLGFKLGADNRFDPMPAVVGPDTTSQSDTGAGVMTISSNGPRDGILWATIPNGDVVWNTRTGTLRAYNATDGKLLWRSDTNKPRDDLGLHAKFCPPTIANGKVYVGTWTGTMVDANSFALTSGGALQVYGTLP